MSDFNKLKSQDKWDTWKEQEGTWHCSKCKTQLGDGPNRCSPFPRSSVNCGNCDAELTRRTGGGQCDPFGWELRGPHYVPGPKDCEGRCPNCDAEQDGDPEDVSFDGATTIWICHKCGVRYEEFTERRYANSEITSWRIGLEVADQVTAWVAGREGEGDFDLTRDPEEASIFDDREEARIESHMVIERGQAYKGRIWVEPAPYVDQR